MPSSQSSAAHRIRCSPSTKEEGKRWIVVGPGARRVLGSGRSSPDRFPGTLLTDFYAPIDRVALRQVHSLGDKQRLQCRLAPELPSVGRNTSAWLRSARRLGDRAGRAAQKSDWGIIAYSQVATSALRNAGEAPKVLMQIPPHPVRSEQYLRLTPCALTRLMAVLMRSQAAGLREVCSRTIARAFVCRSINRYTQDAR